MPVSRWQNGRNRKTAADPDSIESFHPIEVADHAPLPPCTMRPSHLRAQDDRLADVARYPEGPASLADDVDDTLAAFDTFSRLMAKDGIRAALYSVLCKSDYRFIGIFRFRDGKATSAVHVDRMDLNALQAATVDETATYCTLVRDGRAPFVTADATVDPRTTRHDARDVVRAYAGIPIVAPDGEFIGTLCHYDLEPRSPEQLDLALLLRVAGALARSGQVPPYPGS